MSNRATLHREAEERFRRYLAERGLRLTRERREVMSFLLRAGRDLDAEAILARAKERGESFSRATLYRTLDHLVKSGLVRQAPGGRPAGKEPARFERAVGPSRRGRLVCLSCGRIDELPGTSGERDLDRICARQGFLPQYHYLEVFGLCRECRRGLRSRARAAVRGRARPRANGDSTA